MEINKDITIILLASGNSTRFSQESLPKKQWLRIQDKPLWQFVYDLFLSFGFEQIILTASNQQECQYMQLLGYQAILGGETRTLSLLQALQKVTTPYVLVNDAARWNIPKNTIDTLIQTAKLHPHLDCIAPSLKLADTLHDTRGAYPPREYFEMIQTPQLSKTKILIEALNQGEFSDESSAIFHHTRQVCYVPGSPLLHKLTTQEDLLWLRTFASPPSTETLIGNGLDIHAFENGKPMRLCGIEIPSPFGFKAHSDGDVAIHAIIDAMLGAIGAGDIGEWFPDTDERFKGADSMQLLRQVSSFLRDIGYTICNLDLTLVAQIPKITPHKAKMREHLAHLLNLPQPKISLKATTAEKMGFIGREEGVCAICTIGVKFYDWSHQ